MSTMRQATFVEEFHHPDAINVHLYDRALSAGIGAFLATSGLVNGGRLRMLLGAEMLRRAFTGHCYAYQALGVRTVPAGGNVSVPYELGAHVRLTITIARPRHEVYSFWRDFSNLSKAMGHVIAVEDRGSGVTHWKVQGPAEKVVEWDAQIISESVNERIGWRTLPGSQVDSAGSVRFADAAQGSTEVRIELQYNPPGGFITAYASKVMGSDARALIEEDCRRLKEYLESRGVEQPTRIPQESPAGL
jgi:uncharacterized membrane protein